MTRRQIRVIMLHQGGFTLLEVVIALAILAVSLMVLLESQVSSLANAGRARDLTIATLLARAKMVDVEQRLFDEGFTMGDLEDNGDFTEEGHALFKWHYKVSEVEFDLSSLGDLCGSALAVGGEEGEDEGGGCEGMLSGLGGPLSSLTGDVAQAVRAVDLVVTWPVGKFEESLSLRSLATREDFGTVAGGVTAPAGIGNTTTGGTGTNGVVGP